MNDEFDLDLSGPFTFDELVEIESIAGTGETVGPHSGRFLRALALVLKRRSNPDATLAEVGELTVSFDREG